MLAAGATAAYLHLGDKPPSFPVLLAAEVGVGFVVMLIATFITKARAGGGLEEFLEQGAAPGRMGPGYAVRKRVRRPYSRLRASGWL